MENIVNMVLVVDKAGKPRDWADEQTGACYYARNKVLAEFGTPIKTFYGGHNMNGDVSEITVSSIISVSGPIFSDKWFERETIYADRQILYARDRHLCAYCGEQFKDHQLTIDHILPRSKGGKNTWVNTVSACKPCNVEKADRTPEQAKMHLLFVPYAPNMFEKMILKNRKILQDQMEFLMTRVPKHSRLHQH